MTLLPMLHLAEQDLKHLLRLRQIDWKSVYVNYHEPYVERLWCEWEDYRLYLHRIHPMRGRFSVPLFHPHPWPSAMKVVSGVYEMSVGHGAGEKEPPIVTKMILPRGSEYEMSNPDAWHSVRPIGGPSLSVMITGKPWERWSPKSEKVGLIQNNSCYLSSSSSIS